LGDRKGGRNKIEERIQLLLLPSLYANFRYKGKLAYQTGKGAKIPTVKKKKKE